MGGKRDASYFKERLRREHPAIFVGLRDGTYPSVRAAAAAAGLIRQPTRLGELKRAWKKASPAEKRAFVAWVGRVRKPIGAKKLRTGRDLIDANGWLTAAVATEFNRVLAVRGIKLGEVMREMGMNPLNASIGNAVKGPIKLHPDTLDRLAAWLDKNAS